MPRHKYILIADYPAPWRERVYELVHSSLGDDFHVAYCTPRETRRKWNFQQGTHGRTFLRVLRIRFGKRERYINPDIIPFLLRHRPRMLICFSLYPSALLSLVLGRLMGSTLIVFADTWLGRDRSISRLQRLTRTVVYRYFADAFIGASENTLEMFRHYRPTLLPDRLFLSHLCADNEQFLRTIRSTDIPRDYDLVFSGRFSSEKNPLFFARVCSLVQARLGHCRALILGSGRTEIRAEMERILTEGDVDHDFRGFVDHSQLPYLYPRGKLFLFPTSGDCWGVVVNEAMVSGLPVLTTQWTAAAGELVRHGENGYVLPLDEELWAEEIVQLLGDERKLRDFRTAARQAALSFDFSKAARGLVDAIRSRDPTSNVVHVDSRPTSPVAVSEGSPPSPER